MKRRRGEVITMSVKNASKIRFAVRAALVCVTAFGLRLSGDQVAAVQLLAEAALQFFVKEGEDNPSEDVAEHTPSGPQDI